MREQRLTYFLADSYVIHSLIRRGLFTPSHHNRTQDPSLISDIIRVPYLRGDLEAHRRWRHLPLPGGKGPSAGPPPQLRRRLALRPRDVEVRTTQRLLQRPNAVPTTCNTQYMPSYADMGEVHE